MGRTDKVPIATHGNTGGRSDMTCAYDYEAMLPPMTAMFINKQHLTHLLCNFNKMSFGNLHVISYYREQIKSEIYTTSTTYKAVKYQTKKGHAQITSHRIDIQYSKHNYTNMYLMRHIGLTYEQFSKGRSKNVTEGVNFKL